MSTWRRALARALVAATALTAVGLTPPAHADRCEPEELVLGPDTSPIDERDHPLCTVMFYYVYPFICTNGSTTPPPTLLTCLRNLSLQPGYRPPLIPPYRPSVNRIVCNLYLFVFPTGTCTFSAAGLQLLPPQEASP